MNFEKYIGIPFLEKGRDATGLDCWGLVRLIYKQEYNINLPSFATDYTLSDDERIGELFAQYKEGWEVLDNPQPGSAVIFRMFGTESHIGVVVDNSRFIHVREGRDTVIESLESGKWAKRIVGFFQYSEKSNVVLNAVPHPLKTQRYTTTVVPGTLVTELVQNICQEYNIQPELKSRISVLVNGQVVEQEAWSTTRIKLGDVVEYRAVPGKEAVRMIAIIAIAVYAPYLANAALGGSIGVAVGATGGVLAGSTFLAGVATAGVMLVGSTLVNAIAPIRPPAAPGDPGTSLRQDIISGGQNRGNPYGSIPVVLGKLRITPPLGSNNYLSFENERDSFLSMLLVWGYGPLVIDATTLKIGGVPLASFPKHTISTLNRIAEPTSAELTTFNSIYGQDYSPAIQAGPLVCDGNPEVTVTPGPWVNAATDIELDVVTELAVPVTQVRIDLHFPQGLRYIISKGDGAGESRAAGVEFRVEYSTNNGATYAYLDTFVIGGDTPKKDAFTTTKSYNNLNYNQLIVRVRRQTGDNVEDNPDRRYYFDSILQNITFVRNTTPAVDPVGSRIAKTAFKIQASEQLNGSLEGISAVVQTWCKTWGNAWLVTEAASGVNHYLGSQETVDLRNKTATFSVPIKLGTAPSTGPFTLWLRDGSEVNVAYATFNFSSITSSSGLGISRMTPLGNGWYNCSITGSFPANATIGARIYIDPDNPPTGKTYYVGTPELVDGTNSNPSTWNAIAGTASVVSTSAEKAWVYAASSNPAALMRYVLEHPANPRRVTDASTQINLAQLQYFYTYCESKGFEYNDVLSTQRSILEVIRDICAAGRASPALLDGKWSVVIDEPRANVVQHFTPHNSWNFEGTKALPKRPDGLRVTYYDQDQDYQQAEIIVYENGKSSVTATLFESITLPGVTKKSLVIDHARWHLAQMKLRPEVYTLNTDLEYLVCNRGDRVKVVHDVPMWGIGSGRVKNRISGTQLELDEAMPMKANVNYTLRFRSSTGSSVTRAVASKPVDGYYDVIDVTSTTITEANAGDLFLFGELNQESQDLVVLAIEPSTNNSARITLVDYGVTDTYNIFNDYLSLSAATVFETQITLPPVLQQNGFGDKLPTVTGFVSDESVMERVSKGVFKYAINVAYFNNAELPETTESVQLEYELTSSTSSLSAKTITVPFQKGSVTISDVSEGETYKVRLRYIGSTGVCGKWTSYSNHTVVGKVNPPAQVTGFSVTPDKASGQLKLSWNENFEPDTYTYEIRKSDSNWGLANTDRLFLGDSINTFVQNLGNTTYYIKAVDSSGNYSVLPSSVTFTSLALPNISNLEHSYFDTSLTNATVILSWVDVVPVQFAIDYYEVTYVSGIEPITNNVKSNTITLPADWVGNRTFTVKVVDILGNKSSGYTGNITKLAPNPITGYRAQVIDNNVLLYWTNGAKTSLPIAHVLIKRSQPGGSWATATVLGTKSGEFTSISELSGGDYVYWLAAVDTDGVESVPVEVPATVSQPPDFKFTAEFISPLTGTLSNAKSYAGELFLPVNTSETWTTHFTSRGWAGPSAQVSAGYPLFIQPGASSGFYEEIFDCGTILASSQITLNSIETDVSGSTTSSSTIYISTDGITYSSVGTRSAFGTNFRFIKVRIDVSQNSVGSIRKISDLRIRLDSKQKSEADYVTVPATGKIVNFASEFIDVQSIILTSAGTSTTSIISVYDFKDAVVTGTYSITSNTATITAVNHGLIAGQKVRLYFTTGTGISGLYIIQNVINANSYTVNIVTANTSGNVTTYPNSMVIYSFTSNTGAAVASTTSYQIKGY